MMSMSLLFLLACISATMAGDVCHTTDAADQCAAGQFALQIDVLKSGPGGVLCVTINPQPKASFTSSCNVKFNAVGSSSPNLATVASQYSGDYDECDVVTENSVLTYAEFERTRVVAPERKRTPEPPKTIELLDTVLIVQCDSSLFKTTAVIVKPFVRKRQDDGDSTSFSLSSSGTLSLGGISRADPHVVGASGQLYDFDGPEGAVYGLFTAPNFAVNVRLSDAGEGARFMNTVGIVFRNTTLQFASKYAFIPAMLNAALAPFGTATGNQYHVTLELCDGHRVDIVKKYVDSPKQHKRIYYLNVEFRMAGCHNEFDGIVGRTFQCRFVSGTETFEWHKESTESFRLASLQQAPDNFVSDAACVKAFKNNTEALHAQAQMMPEDMM